MILERFRLDKKVAIVSGGGRGIGRGIALALAEAGAALAIGARTVEEIEKTAADCRKLGASALAVPCDVSDPGQLKRLSDSTLEKFGRIDVLVNVAGGALPTLALHTDPEDFNAAFDFNVTAAFRLIQLTVPHMQKTGGGSVVNISSALSHLVDSGFVAYGTAKAALSHMTRLLAFEFAPVVRVNAIACGAIETEALAPFLAQDGLKEKMEALTPMARLGTPEDIALMALYLASPASSWVTGKIFEVDGGTVASNWPIRLKAF